MHSIDSDFWLDLAQIQAEFIGWIPLDEGVYLHEGCDASPSVIDLVGLPKQDMQGSTLPWVF
jgi:hypothetical protein